MAPGLDSRPAISNPLPGPRFCSAEFRFFAVVKVSHILTACPYSDNLEFDISVAGGPQCHFITSVTIAARIGTRGVTGGRRGGAISRTPNHHGGDE